MGTITTKDGTQIYYKDWGKGQPIVFSHGWPLSADDWDAQMLFFLKHGYRAGRESLGSDHPELVAPRHDGRREGALRWHRRLLTDRFHRRPEEDHRAGTGDAWRRR